MRNISDLEHGFNLIRSKKYEDAYHFFTEQLNSKNSDPATGDFLKHCLYGQANALSELSVLQEKYEYAIGAIPILKRTIDLYPDWYPPYINLAEIYYRHGNMQCARATLLLGLHHNQTNAILGSIYQQMFPVVQRTFTPRFVTAKPLHSSLFTACYRAHHIAKKDCPSFKLT